MFNDILETRAKLNSLVYLYTLHSNQIQPALSWMLSIISFSDNIKLRPRKIIDGFNFNRVAQPESLLLGNIKFLHDDYLVYILMDLPSKYFSSCFQQKTLSTPK